MLVWASVAIEKVEFTRETPTRKILRLNADSIFGKEILTINNVLGIYENWYVTAASGTFNTTTYDATATYALIRHNNLEFSCIKGAYTHNAKVIQCYNGKLQITS